MSTKEKIGIAVSVILGVIALLFGAVAILYFALGFDIFGFEGNNVSFSSAYCEKLVCVDVPANKPEQVRGAFISYGTDYMKNTDSEQNTVDTVKAEIDACINGIKDMSFNAVFVDAVQNGEIVTVSQDNSMLNVLEYAVGQAKQAELYTFCCVKASDVFDVGAMSVKQDFLTKLCSAYAFDALLITDFNTLGSVAQTEKMSSLLNYAKWTVKQARGDIYFGAESSAVWANESETTPDGSVTTADYQALSDGFDTLAWAVRGSVDYIFANLQYSTKDSKAPFETLAKWWSEQLSDCAADLIVGHSAYKICSSEYAGWQSPDELVKQASIASTLKNCKGSAYRTYSSLAADVQNSTSVLLNYYGGQVKDELIFNELVVTKPSSSSVKTNESVFNIAGSSDPNFPLFINGTEVSRSEYGYFSKDINLTPGKNTVTVTHKGATKTFSVNYERILIQSVSPSEATYAMGGSYLTITAVAFKNAAVYATINGAKVPMSVDASASDEFNTTDGSDFTKYIGEYKLPASTTKEQNLGTVEVVCTYDGYTYSKKGGAVTVNKIIENPTMVEITSANAEVRSSEYTGTAYNPAYTPLVERTLDYYIGDVKIDGSKFYILKSGRRVLASKVELRNYTSMSDNTLALQSVSVSGNATTVRLKTDWNVPFNVITGSVAKTNAGFNAGYVDIKFDYTPFVSGSVDFSASGVIKSSEWINNGDGSSTLRLYLLKASGFYGYTASYGAGGVLDISFKNHSTSSLAGKVITIDAGHGACDDAAGNGLDPGAIGTNRNYPEYVITYKVAQKVKEQLEAKGATVYLVRTSLKTTMLQPQRVTKIIDCNPDASVSIHCNSSVSSAPFGVEGYYFYNYSQPLAANITSKLAAAYSSIYGGALPNTSYSINRGAKYGEYAVSRVTNCPAVLMEIGFISNESECTAIVKDINGDNKIAKAVADGIESYFAGR